jgi:hypothetical protein
MSKHFRRGLFACENGQNISAEAFLRAKKVQTFLPDDFRVRIMVKQFCRRFFGEKEGKNKRYRNNFSQTSE